MGAPVLLEAPPKSLGDAHLQDMGHSTPHHQVQGMLTQQSAHNMVAAYIKENEELLGAVAALQECNGALESHAAALATENAELKKVQFQLRQQLADALARLEAEAECASSVAEGPLRMTDSATDLPNVRSEDCTAWGGFKDQMSVYRPVKCLSALDVVSTVTASSTSAASPYRTSPRSWGASTPSCGGDSSAYTNPLASSDASSSDGSESESHPSSPMAPSFPLSPASAISAFAAAAAPCPSSSSPWADPQLAGHVLSSESPLTCRLSHVPKLGDLATGSISSAPLGAAFASGDIDSWAELQAAAAAAGANADKAMLPTRHSLGSRARMWSLSSVSATSGPATATHSTASPSLVPPTSSPTTALPSSTAPHSSYAAPPSPLSHVWSRCKRAVSSSRA